MNQLLEWLSRIFGSWKFWIVIPPWDVGVRVRFGKIASELQAGPHWRVPFIDEIVLINTRVRIVIAPSITIGIDGSKTRVVTASVSYQIVEPVKAMLSFAGAEHAVMCLVQSMLCDGKSPDETKQLLDAELLSKGIKINFVKYVEDVRGIRTYRLLSDTWKPVEYNNSSGVGGAGMPTGTTRW